MANNQSYIDGLTEGGKKVTALSEIQGAGLKLPYDFIDIREPGKLARLFNYDGNNRRLYSLNRPEDTGLNAALKNRFEYKNPNEGQKQTRFQTRAGYAIQDARLVRSFLGSKGGKNFILKQLILQGFQPFDETKVYNPASPLVAAIRQASFGALDRPVRHIDTSNIVGGLANSFGLGGIISTVGKFMGAEPPQPAPPRSSVAARLPAQKDGFFKKIGIPAPSDIGKGLLGANDRTDEVVAPIARGDVKGLLRGQTATNAYNAPRYSRLVNNPSNGGGFFSNLLKGVGSFLKNNSLLGGIIPPSQPWDADYRADEKTYDYYLSSGQLFTSTVPKQQTKGLLDSVLSSLGLFKSKSKKQSTAVVQRFFNKSTNSPSIQRPLTLNKISNKVNKSGPSELVGYTDTVGKKTDGSNQITSEKVSSFVTEQNNKKTLKYTDVVKVVGDVETSDQLENYSNYTKTNKNNKINKFSTKFSDQEDNFVQKLNDIFNKTSISIAGGAGEKYTVDSKNNFYPLQFSKFDSNSIGMDYLNEIQSRNNISENQRKNTYTSKIRNDKSTGKKHPTRLGKDLNDRFIRPTNNVDYVNALTVLNEEEFKKQYGNTDQYGVYGPDIVKFYFYDILNKKYIPFTATIRSINDNNSATWETVEYLGRPDKLYYYKGFSRSVSFNFSVNAHSIKELMPMWQRINYLVGLTRPANYTLGKSGGFMISPMVQLTLGDFYKNHNVVINSCNVSIPEDAAWETIPEEMSGEGWHYGIGKTIKLPGDKGNVAQFPRHADIQIEMNVLEKDRPMTGRSIWGDAPFNILEFNSATANGTVTNFDINEKEKVEKIQNKDFPSSNNFSQNIRTDNNIKENSIVSAPNPPGPVGKDADVLREEQERLLEEQNTLA